MSGSQVCELGALPNNYVTKCDWEPRCKVPKCRGNHGSGSLVPKKGDSYSLLAEQIFKMLLSHNVSIVVCLFCLIRL